MIKMRKQPPLPYREVGVEKSNNYIIIFITIIMGSPRCPAVIRIPDPRYDSLLSSSRPSTDILKSLVQSK